MLPWMVIAGLMVALLLGVALVTHFSIASSPQPLDPPVDGTVRTEAQDDDVDEAAATPGEQIVRAVSTGQNGVRLSLQGEPGAPTVGDPIVLDLTLSMPEDHFRTLPSVEDQPPFAADTWTAYAPWGEAEILRLGEMRRESSEGRVRLQRQVTLTAFRSGAVELPPLPVRLGDTELLTPPVELYIRSVLSDAADGQPPASSEGLDARPYRPPVQLPLGGAFWWTTAFLGLACLLVASRLWRSQQLTSSGSPLAAGPLADLLELLDELRRENDAEAFHVRLSEGFRRYLGQHLGFAAIESTTREVDHRLDAYRRRRHGPRLETAQQTLDLLRQCDRVKFAGEAVDPVDLRHRLAAARRLAKTLDAELRPPSGDASE